MLEVDLFLWAQDHQFHCFKIIPKYSKSIQIEALYSDILKQPDLFNTLNIKTWISTEFPTSLVSSQFQVVFAVTKNTSDVSLSWSPFAAGIGRRKGLLSLRLKRLADGDLDTKVTVDDQKIYDGRKLQWLMVILWTQKLLRVFKATFFTGRDGAWPFVWSTAMCHSRNLVGIKR